MGTQLAPAATFTKQKLSFTTLNIKEAGYVFVYLSYDNDSNNWVYFDDLKVSHTKSNVLQYNEYYPFGLQSNTSWTREGNSNNFLYNDANELNQNSGWYETFFRGYDPILGRFHQVDPLAHASSSHTPYTYAFNDPVFYNDPNGDYPQEVALDMERSGGSGQAIQTFPGDDNFASGGNPYRIGPGSGNHWTDGYSSAYRDYFLMNSSAFQGKHNQSVFQFREQVRYEAALAQSEPYSVDAWDYGPMGNQLYQYTFVNGSPSSLTTYALDAGGGGEINTYKFDQESGDFVSQGGSSIFDRAPSDWGNYIPVYGPGRQAAFWFGEGDVSRGLMYSALAISDVALVKSMITSVGRIAGAVAKASTNVAKQVAVHGNSLASLRPTWGYKLYSADGTFLKNGITSQLVPEARYTKAFMSDKYMVPFKQFSNRREAYHWEFQQNQILRGPLNLNMH
jgi:RHS repeat-associated protein